MKKILVIIPSLTPGGAEHQTANQLNYLVGKGYDNIHLLVLSNKVNLIGNLKLDKRLIHIIESNSLITVEIAIMRHLFQLAVETYKLIRAEKITDVIAILPLAHIIGRLAKLMNKILLRRSFTLNTYYRDVYYQVTPWNTPVKKVLNYLNSLLAYLFDNRTLFISKAVHDDIKANIYIRNPLVLPNSLPDMPVPPDQGLSFLKHQGVARQGEYLILVPGRLHSKKGHELFVRAFSNFVKQKNLGPQHVKVIIAGDGPQHEIILERIDELGIKEHFFLIGFTENKLLLSLYKCCDLVVIPSIHEGFGNVAIEGLLQQSLMLVSDTGGLAEIIRDGENGFLFKKGNEESLTCKLNYLYDNRDAELVNREALYDDFKSKYTLERQVNTLLDFCQIRMEGKRTSDSAGKNSQT